MPTTALASLRRWSVSEVARDSYSRHVAIAFARTDGGPVSGVVNRSDRAVGPGLWAAGDRLDYAISAPIIQTYVGEPF